MKKIILHVGSGKTGSTSIQSSLYLNNKKNSSSLTFPPLLQYKNNQIFRFAFCNLENTPSDIRSKYLGDDEGYKKFQNDIKTSFERNTFGCENVIISSEFLFLSSREEALNIKEYLNELGFDEIHIVMYLRDPASYYLSVAQQSVKNNYRLPRLNNFGYNMIGAIDIWKSIQPKSLTVKEFCRDTLLNHDVVIDFEAYLATLGYSISLGSSAISNQTMSTEGCFFLQNFHWTLNQLDLKADQVTEYKDKARKFSKHAVGGTKPILKNKYKNSILSLYKDEMVKIYEEFGIFKQQTQPNARDEVEQPKLFIDLVEGFDFDVYLKLMRGFI